MRVARAVGSPGPRAAKAEGPTGLAGMMRVAWPFEPPGALNLAGAPEEAVSIEVPETAGSTEEAEAAALTEVTEVEAAGLNGTTPPTRAPAGLVLVRAAAAAELARVVGKTGKTGT